MPTFLPCLWHTSPVGQLLYHTPQSVIGESVSEGVVGVKTLLLATLTARMTPCMQQAHNLETRRKSEKREIARSLATTALMLELRAKFQVSNPRNQTCKIFQIVVLTIQMTQKDDNA